MATLTAAQQAARDKLKATRTAQKASGLSNAQILQQTQGTNRYVAPKSVNYSDPQLGTQTNKNGINTSSYGPVSNNRSVQDPAKAYVDNSVLGTYQQGLSGLNDKSIIKDIRSAYEPGMENIRNAYEEGRSVAQDTAQQGVKWANQGYKDAATLAEEQRQATERDRALATERTGTAFDELINQTNLSKTDVERSLQRRREEAQLAQDEARTAIEQKLPASLERTRAFLAQRHALSTSQAATELGYIERDQNNQLALLERQGAIDKQEIASLEQDLTRTYNESLVNFSKQKAEELTGIENAALKEISAINADQRLSMLDKNREISRIQQALETEQNRITTEIAQAEKDNEEAIRTELVNRRNQIITQATQAANFRQQDIGNEATYLGTYNGQQTMESKSQDLANIAQQVQTRAMESAITGYDPITGKPTFDMQKYNASLDQFAQELGLKRDQLDEVIRSNQANEDIARGKASQAGTMTPEEKANMEIKLANNFQKYANDSQTALRSIGNVNAGYDSAVNALKEGKPLSAQSQAVIIGFNKLLDPTSVVRESEYARTPEGQSLLQSLQGEYISITQGGAGLTEEGLRNIKDMALQLAEGYKNEQLGYAQLIANQADSYGLNLENILPPDQLSLYYGYDVNLDAGEGNLSDVFETSKKKLSNESAQKLLNVIPAPQGLKEIAAAIMQHEGYDVKANGGKGTLSVRNNNPGNLRFIGQEGGSQGEGGFARFDSLESGFMALINDIKAKATGNTRTGLNGNSTLYDLFKVYAPASDNNNPKVYAETVAKKLGVSPTTKIGTLIA